MYKRFSNNIIIDFLGIIIYRLLLDISFYEILVKLYSYFGFVNNSNFESFFISWLSLLLFVPFVLDLYSKSLMSSNIIVLLFLLSYVPMTSMMAFMPMNNVFLASYVSYWLIIFIMNGLVPSFTTKFNYSYNHINFALWSIILLLGLSIVYVSGMFFSFRLSFNLNEVYELRRESVNVKIPLFFNYILPAAGNILPILLVYFIYKRRVLFIILLSIVILLNFSIGGHKAIFYKLIISILGFYLFKNYIVNKFSWAFSSLILISLIEYYKFETFFTFAFGVRRLLFIPAFLNYQYFKFFSINEYDIYRQSFLKYFLSESPYKETISHEIGSFMGQDGMGANNGLFSDAYANMGYWGLLIHPLILIIIFKLLDQFATRIHIRFLFLPIIVSASTFNNSFFPTALLTHGILLLMLVLYLYPRDFNKNYEKYYLPFNFSSSRFRY